MKRVLIVAYYFPPLGGIGSVRVASFARYLADYGWHATVLAPRNGAYFRDETLTFPEGQIIRTGGIELSRAGKQLLRVGGDDVQASAVTGPRAVIKKAARRYLYFPDAQVGWLPPALLAARRHVRIGEFDAIFSSSFPMTAHLVARRLHRRLGIPWVAEFRDPWSAALPLSSSVRPRAERLEAAISREASALITVSPSWAEMFAAMWSREVRVVRNGHDGTVRTSRPPRPEFILGYLGTYYPESQSLSALWAAVAAARSEDHLLANRIRFVGELHPALAQELSTHGLGGLIDVTGFMPHQQALDKLSEATALVVAGPREANGTFKGHVVAKLSEYLAMSRPIIYVGDPTADAAKLLSEYPGTHIVPTGDVAAALEALRQSRNELVSRNADALDRRTLTGELATILDEVVP